MKKSPHKSASKANQKKRAHLFEITVDSKVDDADEVVQYVAEIVVMPRKMLKKLEKAGVTPFSQKRKIKRITVTGKGGMQSFTVKLRRGRKKWAQVRVARVQDGKQLAPFSDVVKFALR